MKVQFLGTAAAEGWPGLFCPCSVCKRALEIGGKNIRTRSSLLIDDQYMVDFGPDTYLHFLQNKIDLCDIEHLLITHSHSDHFYPEDLMHRGMHFAHLPEGKAPLTVYGNEKVTDIGNRMKEYKRCDDTRLLFKEAKAFEPIQMGEAVVTPLLAEHDKREKCFIYIVESHGQKLLIGHDSGYFGEETWSAIAGHFFDAVIFECTFGATKEGRNHMGIPDVIEVKETLTTLAVIGKSTKLFITHFSHNGKLLHHELEQLAAPHGIEVAYDGKTALI